MRRLSAMVALALALTGCAVPLCDQASDGLFLPAAY